MLKKPRYVSLIVEEVQSQPNLWSGLHQNLLKTTVYVKLQQGIELYAISPISFSTNGATKFA